MKSPLSVPLGIQLASCFFLSFFSSKLLGQFRGFAYIRVDFARQRLEERYQLLPLLGCEIELLDIAGQPGVFDSAPIVESDDFLERLLAAVMHIRTTPRHVPQCWCLEGALIGLVLRHGV